MHDHPQIHILPQLAVNGPFDVEYPHIQLVSTHLLGFVLHSQFLDSSFLELQYFHQYLVLEVDKLAGDSNVVPVFNSPLLIGELVKWVCLPLAAAHLEELELLLHELFGPLADR